MSNLLQHAKNELKLAGLYDKDSDYNGMIGKAVQELIEVFSKQGHSGYSNQLTRYLFNKLGNWENITPITNKPEEWMNLSDKVWQSIRNPSIFSNDNLKSWYHLDDIQKKNKRFPYKQIRFIKYYFFKFFIYKKPTKVKAEQAIIQQNPIIKNNEDAKRS